MSNSSVPSRANLYLALAAIAGALLIAFVWVPMDSASGLILKVRRQVSIGDAMAPTLAAGMIGLGGLLLLVQKEATHQKALSWINIKFLIWFLSVCLVALLLMRWSGPLAVWTAGHFVDMDGGYRSLRDTAPWKHIGFVLGGVFLVTALISRVEGQVRLRTLFVALLAVGALIALFDLPFDDLLLPPNGDV